MSHLDRITSDPEICHGKPVVRGLRYPIDMLLGLLASGMATEEILDDYPDLQFEDILGVLEYAARGDHAADDHDRRRNDARDTPGQADQGTE
ncbi:DUF433 domain-containing protein [Nocardia cyriacigeorgica]|uniref:DUF433 domain-containing protein n=1 Tax=Nocardia cyriacigeorgica TaxID=135487 RepID=A0A5R8PBY4_9NOCA|nr:DUF433 domain-containing protein [Nocardia cyriacigeorgica]TLG07791.1 DUF433 domain-containing protein [Nocardia cyriacigeorgica]